MCTTVRLINYRPEIERKKERKKQTALQHKSARQTNEHNTYTGWARLVNHCGFQYVTDKTGEPLWVPKRDGGAGVVSDDVLVRYLTGEKNLSRTIQSKMGKKLSLSLKPNGICRSFLFYYLLLLSFLQ